MLQILWLILASTTLANVPNLTDENKNIMERYVLAHSMADFLVMEFDKELENPRKNLLQKSATYKKLLTLRGLMHEMVDELSSRPELKREFSDFYSEVRLSPKILENFPEFSPGDLPALEDLGEKVGNLPPLFANSDERNRHKRIYGARAMERAKTSKHSIPQFQLETFDEKIFFIKPDPGSSGNINGSNFPMDTWALTYDDGPGKSTASILSLLKSHKKKATFFWLAENFSQNKELVDMALEAKMPLQNHSFTHANLAKLVDAQLRFEIEDSSTLQTQFFGEKPKFFRCPYGSGLNLLRVRKWIAKTEMVHVFWNVDSLDWQDKNPQSILARVKKQMKAEKRGIILFHDIHSQTLEATRMLLDTHEGKNLKSKLRWVTIPEIVDELNRKQGQWEE